MLLPAIHLPHDLDGLARFVVKGEEKNGRIHNARGLVVQSAEELSKVARVSTQGC